MKLFLMFFKLCFFISGLLLFFVFLLNKKSVLLFEKSSPFECGFNPKSFFRTPFSIQFFLIALLFLIFDVELILLYPFLLKNVFFMNIFHLIFCLMFFLILFVGLYHEWNQKSLQWS